jgi:hypothetical protein
VRIENEEVLTRFRGARCELCGGGPSEAHHIRSKGVCRLDVAINLIAVCRRCHGRIHLGSMTQADRRLTREDLWEIVSRRDGVAVADIIAELNRLRDLPADAGERRPRSKFKRHPRCQLPGCHRSTQGRNLYVGTVPACPQCWLSRPKENGSKT